MKVIIINKPRKMAEIVGAVIVLLVLICLVGALCYFRRQHNRQTENELELINTENPVRNWSSR